MPARHHRLSRAFAVAALTAWSFNAPAFLATSTAAQAVIPAKPKIAIDNFGMINANYYRGAQPEGRDYADLAALGVKTVINLTSFDADTAEQGAAEGVGMNYVQIPMATRVVPTEAQISKFLSIVNDPKMQPVYVHCVGGRHRTGVMTAIYRMNADKWTGAQAFKEMKSYKYGADFLHPEFKAFVYAYRPDVDAASAAAPQVVAEVAAQ